MNEVCDNCRYDLVTIEDGCLVGCECDRPRSTIQEIDEALERIQMGCRAEKETTMANTKKTIHDKLLEIQVELHAPKSSYNKYGNYAYRNLDSIFEAVKPLLKKMNVSLIMVNDIEDIGGRLFRKSTATLLDIKTGETITSHTYTQEAIDKKGMSAEQCSGSTSSYSDKYCLAKLFLIDDTKDADATNKHEDNSEPVLTHPPSNPQPKPQSFALPFNWKGVNGQVAKGTPFSQMEREDLEKFVGYQRTKLGSLDGGLRKHAEKVVAHIDSLLNQ